MTDMLFSFDKKASTSSRVESVPLRDVWPDERKDLQEWIINNPEVLGEGILVVSSEFDRWSTEGGENSRRRPDILGLDPAGRLVVAELKLSSDRNIHIQAITYAAMAAGFDEQTLSEAYADFLSKREIPTTVDEALGFLRAHVGGELDPAILSVPRIILVAEQHPPEVLTTVVWLSDLGLDVEVREVRSYAYGGNYVVSVDQVYPVVGVESQLLTPARRQVDEVRKKIEEKEETARASDAVRIIVKQELLPDGEKLHFYSAAISGTYRTDLEVWIAEDPKRSEFYWVSNASEPIRWAYDNKGHIPSTLAKNMVYLATGIKLRSSPRGTEWWTNTAGEDLTTIAGIAKKDAKKDWTRLHDVIESVQPGEWATYGDLAKLAETSPQPVGNHIATCLDCPEGAYRIMPANGKPSAGFRWTDSTDTRTCREVLEGEGVVFGNDGAAGAQHRVGLEELRKRMADKTTP